MPNAISTTIMSSIAQDSDAHEAALRSGDLVFSKMGGGNEGFPARLELSVASDALANAHVTRTRSLL